MKTYQQLKEEAIELQEIRIPGLGGGRRRAKEYEDQVRKAAQEGPENLAKERLTIGSAIIGTIAGTIKRYPRAFLIALGVLLADFAQSGTSGFSLSGWLANKALGGAAEQVKEILPELGMLGAIGFGTYGAYRVLKLIVTRGPAYVEAMMATRDNKTLAYTFKKEFGVDVFTDDVRVGTPGQGKIGGTV